MGPQHSPSAIIKEKKTPTSSFLDAPSLLFKRVCLYVRPSVRPSVSILKNAVYRLLGASCAVYPALFSID